MAPGKSGQLLEAFKFVVYLSVPVVVVAATSFYPSNLEWVIRNRSYVVYPEEAKRPPTVCIYIFVFVLLSEHL